MSRDINSFSFDEILEEIWLYVIKNSSFDIDAIMDRYTELFNDNISKNKRTEQLYQKLCVIFEKNHTFQEVFLLLNKITNDRLEEFIITIYVHHTLKKFNLDTFKNIQLFTNKKLKEKIISHSFLLFIKEDYEKALLLLDSLDEKERNLSVSRSFAFIYSKNRELAFKLFYEITDKRFQNKILMNELFLFFDEDKDKIIPLLNNMQDVLTMGSAVHNAFNPIFYRDKEKAFELLENIIDTTYYEKTIANSFSKISQHDTNKAISLFNSMKNHLLKYRALNMAFRNMILSEDIFEEEVKLLFNQSEKQYILEYMKKDVIHKYPLSNRPLNDNLLKNKLKKNKNALNFREIFIDNPNKALLILDQTKNKEEKDLLLIQLFNQVLKKGSIRDRALLLLDEINDKHLRESAYKSIIKQIKTHEQALANKLLKKIEMSEEEFNQYKLKNIQKREVAEFLENETKEINNTLYIKFNQLINSKNISEKKLRKPFTQLIEKNSNQAINILYEIDKKNIQEYLIQNYFYTLYLAETKNAFKLLDLLSQTLKKKIIETTHRRMGKRKTPTAKSEAEKFLKAVLFNQDIDFVNIHKAPKKLIENKDTYEKYYKDKQFNYANKVEIHKRFNKLIQENSDKAIDVLLNISNSEIQTYLIKKFFYPVYLEASTNALVLLDRLNQNTKVMVITKTFNQLIDKNSDSSNHITCLILLMKSMESKTLLKKSINRYYDNYMRNSTYIYHLLEAIPNVKNILIQDFQTTILSIQRSLNDKIQQKSIAKAYNTIYINENIIFEERQSKGEDLGIEFLATLLVDERDLNMFKKILAELIKQLEADKFENDYTRLLYDTMVNSHLKHDSLYNLTKYIQVKYFKKNIKKIKEQEEVKNSIDKMLNIVLNNKKKDKYKHFIELFRKKHKMKMIHTAIPTVLKRDFRLGERLFKEVKKEYLKSEIRVNMFEEIYKEDLTKAQVYYDDLDDFHTKVRLSRLAIDEIVPEFSNSLFVRSLSILDTQNIISTPIELAKNEPYEVLKYYGEIKQDEVDELAHILSRIKRLKERRDEAKETRDMKELKNIVFEVGKLKEELSTDDRLFDIFLERYKLDEFEFMELNLLDLVE